MGRQLKTVSQTNFPIDYIVTNFKNKGSVVSEDEYHYNIILVIKWQ